MYPKISSAKWRPLCPGGNELRIRPVMQYGDTNLGQHWLRQWLVARWHHAITWINDDQTPVRSYDIQVRAISQEMLTIWVGELQIQDYSCISQGGRCQVPGARTLTCKCMVSQLGGFIFWNIYIYIYGRSRQYSPTRVLNAMLILKIFLSIYMYLYMYIYIYIYSLCAGHYSIKYSIYPQNVYANIHQSSREQYLSLLSGFIVKCNWFVGN